jgi:uncharacterized membrane protein
MDESSRQEGWVEHLVREEWQALAATERRLGAAEHRALEALLHRTHTARNVNELEAEQQTPGERMADRLAQHLGSWPFVLLQVAVLAAWLTLNEERWTHHWDGYPFDMLNLGLTFLAAFAAPILLMSQNRQQSKASMVADQDFQSDLRQELEITALRALSEELLAVHREQRELLGRIDELTREVHRAMGEVHRAVHEVHHTIHAGHSAAQDQSLRPQEGTIGRSSS